MAHRRSPIYFALALLAIAGAAPLHADDKPKKEHKRFVTEEAHLLITPPEQALWDRLTTNKERDAFIADFWKRRDPTPETPGNEFKDKWLQRIEEARKLVRGERLPGPATERGRVLMAFGSPDGVQEVRPSSGPGGPTQRPGSSGGRLGEDEQPQVEIGTGSGVQDLRPTEIRWRYHEVVPEMGGNTEIVFARDPLGNYRLATPGLNLSQAAIYSLNGLDPTHIPAPGSSAGAEQAGAAAASPSEEPGPSAPQLTGNPIENEALGRLLSEETGRSDIGIHTEPFCFPSQKDSTFVALAFTLDWATLPWSEGEARSSNLVLFGAVLQGSGDSAKKFYDFSIPFTVSASAADLTANPNGAGGSHSIGIPLLPGSYSLLLGIRDAQSTKMTTRRLELTVPDFAQLPLGIPTALFLDGKLERLEAAAPLDQVQQGLVVGTGRLPLRLDHKLSKSADQAALFFLVSGTAADPQKGTPAIRVDYRLKQSGGSEVRLAPQTLPMSSVAQPLPLASREPGDYTITIAVTDTLAGNNRVERQESFTIVP